MKKPISESEAQKRIHAIFYASNSGNEPVKEALLELGRPTKTIVGEDIRFVELNWRVDRPYVDQLRPGKGQFEEPIYEVRHTVIDIEYRTLFFVYEAKMILVHFFKKTSQKTPKSDLDLGWDRMKKWVHAQKAIEQMQKKGKKSHEKKNNPHTGSSFNDFLENEGLEAEVSARAAKKAFIHQLEKRMVTTKANKNKIRKALGSPNTTSRVFDEDYTSLSLDTMTKAANAVGCELQIALVPRKISV